MAETGSRVGEEISEARARLAEAGCGEAELDARLLAMAAFALDRSALLLRASAPVDGPARTRFRRLVERRALGEPVHRILGRRAFYEHEFALSPETLEPRPDTEVLVELAARVIRLRGRPDLLFADLGTGTGAIAVSLLALFPAATALAVDLSAGALQTARVNAEAAGVAARFLPVAGDYLSAFGASLDMVVSNPPYIPSGEIETLAREVRRHDPMLALDGGPDGLSAYRAIASAVGAGPTVPRDVLFEIGAGQADDVAAIMVSAGYDLADSARDLGGHVRALWFSRDSGRNLRKKDGRTKDRKKRLGSARTRL